MRSVVVPDGGFRHIAVIRLSSLGDIVLTLPVVGALRRAYPGARISFWVKEEFADLVRFDASIDHVRALERDARRIEDLVSMGAELEACDLIVDLHGSLRSRLLTFRQKAPVLRAASFRLRRARWVWARWSRPRPVPSTLERYAAALRPLGLSAPGAPQVRAGEASQRWAKAWLEAWPSPGPITAFCPGARHATKQWPEAHWMRLFDAVRTDGRRVLCLSLPAERDALPALRARVESDPGARWCTEPIARMAALLSYCDRAVTCDSGLMHLAAARGVPVVALFGSTSPVLGFAPAGEGHAVLCRNEPCQPCTLHGLEKCPRGHFRCMVELRPDTVLAAWEPPRG
jgi:lipopolysaccharide heptosyltransferase II